MDEADRAIRNRTYELLVELGRAPASDEVGPGAREAWRRLHDEHALVLDEHGDPRMLNPFAVAETAHRVETADGRGWYANCAWDALGVLAALGQDGRVETSCLDCGDRIDLEVRDGEPDRSDTLFHCLVPAAHWWDDIVFT